MMREFKSRYAPGDKVHIDGQEEITAIVIAVTFTGSTDNYYDVAWFSNGSQQSLRLDDWRIKKADYDTPF